MKSLLMNSKVLLIAGIIILIMSLIMDVIGLGFKPGFGAAQIAGTLVGITLIVLGLTRKKAKQ